MILNYSPQTIKQILQSFSKNEKIPKKILRFIDENTSRYGSAQFYLKKDLYYLEIEEDLYNKDFRHIEDFQTHLELVKNENLNIEENLQVKKDILKLAST